jgi:hypothetical protein
VISGTLTITPAIQNCQSIAAESVTGR